MGSPVACEIRSAIAWADTLLFAESTIIPFVARGPGCFHKSITEKDCVTQTPANLSREPVRVSVNRRGALAAA